MTLRKINNYLVVLIILVNGYVLLSPFWPQVVFAWNGHYGKTAALETKLVQTQPADTSGVLTGPNSVVIPSMQLDQPIHEGPATDSFNMLNKGVWRWPGSSTPDAGGNTVLLGHRFSYTAPRGPLYFLHKVKVGERIGIFWEGKRYTYTVKEVKTVPPTDVSILNPTNKPRLTIYTCTPLFNPTQRLVVIAEGDF